MVRPERENKMKTMLFFAWISLLFVALIGVAKAEPVVVVRDEAAVSVASRMVKATGKSGQKKVRLSLKEKRLLSWIQREIDRALAPLERDRNPLHL